MSAPPTQADALAEFEKMYGPEPFDPERGPILRSQWHCHREGFLARDAQLQPKIAELENMTANVSVSSGALADNETEDGRSPSA